MPASWRSGVMVLPNDEERVPATSPAEDDEEDEEEE